MLVLTRSIRYATIQSNRTNFCQSIHLKGGPFGDINLLDLDHETTYGSPRSPLSHEPAYQIDRISNIRGDIGQTTADDDLATVGILSLETVIFGDTGCRRRLE